MRFSSYWFAVILLMVPVFTFAQLSKNEIKKYLKTDKFDIDPDADAVVLYERSDFIFFENQEVWHYKNKVTYVIKINNNKALPLANIKLYCRTGDYNYYISKIQGATYNLSGDEVVATPLKEDTKLKSRENKFIDLISFALPEVKAGSIIEYTYERTGRFWGLPIEHEWNGRYPKLVSILSVQNSRLPALDIITNTRAKKVSFDSSEAALNSSDAFSFWTNGANECLWCLKKVPAFQKEDYSIGYANLHERIELHFETAKTKPKIGDNGVWRQYSDDAWDCAVARSIREPGLFLNKVVRDVVGKDTEELTIMKKVYRYVQTQFTIVDYYYIFSADEQQMPVIVSSDMKENLEKKEVSEQEANILLAAMLNKAGLNAYLLLTSEEGQRSASPDYCTGNRLTHLAVAMAYRGNFILLDAGNKYAVPGVLPLKCYNGYSRIITKRGDFVDLNHNTLHNNNKTSLRIHFKDDSTQVSEFVCKIDRLESALIRMSCDEQHETVDEFLDRYCKSLGIEGEIVAKEIENWTIADTNLYVKLTFENNIEPGKQTYFLPTDPCKVIAKNPFAADVRNYPVEYFFKSGNNLDIVINLPKGYVPDSVHAPKTCVLGTDDMKYTQSTTYVPEAGLLVTNIKYNINQTFFEKERYNDLRKFYDQVLQEEASMVALKKK